MSVEVAKTRDEVHELKFTTEEFRKLPMEEQLAVIYSTQVSLFKYVRELEQKAADMANPEKVQEMMSSMMGGLFS